MDRAGTYFSAPVGRRLLEFSRPTLEVLCSNTKEKCQATRSEKGLCSISYAGSTGRSPNH